METAIGAGAGLMNTSRLEAQYTIPQKDWVMTVEQARGYVSKEIHPELDRLIRDPKIPAGVSRRVSNLFTEIISRKIGYEIVPAYQPNQRGMIAHMDYDPDKSQEVLVVFAPALQQARRDYQKEGLAPRDIEFTTGLIFAHERVHQELAVKNPLKNRMGKSPAVLEVNAQDEAQAWGITVLEMIRTGQKAGYKLPKVITDYSEIFRKFGDNYNNPAWLNGFRKQIGIF